MIPVKRALLPAPDAVAGTADANAEDEVEAEGRDSWMVGAENRRPPDG